VRESLLQALFEFDHRLRTVRAWRPGLAGSVKAGCDCRVARRLRPSDKDATAAA
jgi:hypothetical protein